MLTEMWIMLRSHYYVTFPLLEANTEDTLKSETQINRVIYTLNSSLDETTTVVCFSVITTLTFKVSSTDMWRGKK